MAASIIFLGVNRLSLETEPERIAAHLRPSFIEGEPWTSPDRVGSYNDCLIAAMAILRDHETIELTISAPRIYRLNPPWSVCQGLGRIVLGDRHDGSELDPEHYVVILYHQYWAGQRALLSFALSLLDARDYRWLLYGLSYGILLLGVSLLCLRLARQWPLSRAPRFAADAQKQQIFTDLSILALLLGFLLFLNLPIVGASFDTAPPLIVVFAFVVSSLFVNYAAMSIRLRALVFASLGAIIAYFELLTGSIIIGLVVVIVILSLQRPPQHPSPLPSQRAGASALSLLLGGVAAYCMGFAVCVMLKVLIVELVFHIGMVERFLDLLVYRMTGNARSVMDDPRLLHLFERGDVAVSALVKRVGAAGARLLGFGSIVLGVVIGGLSVGMIAVTAATAVRHWRRLYDPVQVTGLLSCPALIAIWYVAFMQHTLQHPSTMSRCLAPLVAVAAMLAVAVWLRMPTPFREMRQFLTLRKKISPP